jgi:glycerol-3-phosphate acyltransferase PlsX
MGDTGDLPLLHCTEVIGMDDDPGQGVRRKKDSSLVRAAEAVRDGRAMAMVSAGNTGATMASALLRMGRLPGVIRPAIATPIPDLKKEHPTVMLDAGANAEATVPMLLQFAQMGAAYSTKRYGVARPRVALLSIGSPRGPRWSRRPTPSWPRATTATSISSAMSKAGTSSRTRPT